MWNYFNLSIRTLPINEMHSVVVPERKPKATAQGYTAFKQKTIADFFTKPIEQLNFKNETAMRDAVFNIASSLIVEPKGAVLPIKGLG
jgi:hypothetical protein